MFDNVGVCCFDDPSSPSDAWISINGSQAERIQGTSSFSSNVLWVVNLNYDQYKKNEFTQFRNVFDSQYFRISLKALSYELGLEDESSTFVQTASEILTKVAKLGRQYTNLQPGDCGYRYFRGLNDALLPRFARQRPTGPAAEDLEIAFKESTQYSQAMAGKKRPENSAAISFFFPRTAYAQWILGQDYPINSEWAPLKHTRVKPIRVGYEDNRLVGQTTAWRTRLEKLAETESALFKVNVCSLEQNHSTFASFGAGAFYGRSWVTMPEVLELSRYASLEIFEAYSTVSGKLNLDMVDINQIETEYSLSRGILLENIWTGLSQPIDTKKFYTPLGAYMRAYDRIACGRAAEVFNQHNYSVGSYGTGSVVVYLTSSQLPKATAIANELGLLYPLTVSNRVDSFDRHKKVI